MQAASFANAYPIAMRRIVCDGARPIGRIVVDWTREDMSHAVDIAVDPERRASGAGLHLLRAWIAAADALGLPCRLMVRADNPARRIYARLSFVAAQDTRPDEPVVVMTRSPRSPR